MEKNISYFLSNIIRNNVKKMNLLFSGLPVVTGEYKEKIFFLFFIQK